MIVWDAGNGQFLVFAGVADDAHALTDTWVAVAPPVTLVPTSGPVGTVVSVTSGPGWVAGSTARVIFGTSVVKSVTVPANGTVNTTFTVPAKPAGQWPVLLNDDTEHLKNLIGLDGGLQELASLQLPNLWVQNTVTHNNPGQWENPGGGFGTGCSTWNNTSTCVGSGADDFAYDLIGTSS